MLSKGTCETEIRNASVVCPDSVLPLASVIVPDTITGITSFQIPNSNFQIYPNPFAYQSKLTFTNPNKEKFLFTLYDITGKITETVSTTNNEIILTKGSKHPGVYLFNLVNEKIGDSWSGKVLIIN